MPLSVAIACQVLGARRSGVEGTLISLVRELAERAEVQLTLFVPKKGIDYLGPIDPRHEIIPLPFDPGNRLRRIFWETVELPRALRKHRPDLFHGPAYLLPPRCPVPSLVTLHDLQAIERPDLTRLSNRLYYNLALRWTVTGAGKIIASSNATAISLTKRLAVPSEKITVIYPGVDACFDRPASPEEIRLVQERHSLPERYLLFLGSLEPKKNLERLVEAHRQLLQEGFPVDLVLAGEDTCGWQQTSQAVVRHRATFPGRLHLTGHLSDAERVVLMRGATGFVFPSLFEGFGLPPVEALRCGVPVVVSDLPVFRETLGESALFCNPLDTASIAAALRRIILDQPLREHLIACGHKQSRRYTWENQVDQLLVAYRQLAGG